MVGTTLVALRERIDDLADPDGAYRLVCARTGERPVPAADRRFPTRSAARRAARATEQYRAALRRYDPRAPCYDVIVTEIERRPPARSHRGCPTQPDWDLSSPVVSGASHEADRTRRRGAFCHDVAAAVFEALSAGGHDAVEDAVMDAYFDLAERIADPTDLCTCLLESVAGELATQLDAPARGRLLADAAARLGAPDETGGDAVDAAFARCRYVGLVDGYARLPGTGGDPAHGVVEVEGYALGPRAGRLPVLPLVVELARRDDRELVPSVAVRPLQDGWRLTVGPEPGGPLAGVAAAPIRAGHP